MAVIPERGLETTETEPVYTDEQAFSRWSSERLALYQRVDQQVQINIQQSIGLANDLAARMEAETNQRLASYRQQRDEHTTALEVLRQEIEHLRATMAQERQAHTTSLAQGRQEAEAAIAQRQQQAESELTAQHAAANEARERLLADAHAERDQVVAETRQLSTRLGELQQALRSLVGLTGVGAPPQAAPVADAPPPAPPVAVISTDAEPPAVRDNDQLAVLPTDTSAAVPDVVLVDDAAVVDARATNLTIVEVRSFVLASELIDKLERNQAIADVRLIQYEQATLDLRVRAIEAGVLPAVLREQFHEVLEVVELLPGVIRLRARLVPQ